MHLCLAVPLRLMQTTFCREYIGISVPLLHFIKIYMEVKLKMPQAEIISDRLTKFIYLKMIDDKVLTQNDLKEAGINTKEIIKEAVETKLNLGIVSIASAKYGVIGTRESDELIKSL